MSLQPNFDTFENQCLIPDQQKSKAQKATENITYKEPNSNSNNFSDLDSIFLNYQTVVGQLASSQYNISILTANLLHLEQQFEKKQKIFLEKQNEVEKIKKIHKKTHEALQAEIHRSKKLINSTKNNKKQLRQISEETKAVFEKRLKTQEYKNQLYEEFKSLQEEYHSKLEELKRSYQNQEWKENSFCKIKSSRFSKGSRKLSSNSSENESQLTRNEALNVLRQQNEHVLPLELQKAYKSIERMENQLERMLEKRQLIKQTIKDNTQNIKAYQQQQYDLQLRIQTVSKKIEKVSIDEERINQKKSYINELFHQINSLKYQIDQKCSQQNDLENYLREVQKQQRRMRKIRKLQVQCERQQDNYRKQKGSNRFAVIESEQDHQEQLLAQNHQQTGTKPNHPPASRFDSKTNDKIVDLIQRYEKLKHK